MSSPTFVPLTTLYAAQLNSAFASVMNAIPTLIPSLTNQLTNNSGFLTLAPVLSVNNQTGNVILSIPSLTNQLTNNSGFLTLAPVLSVNGEIGNVTLSIPSLTNQLTNNSGFITSSSIPSLTSQLTNNSGFLTSIPGGLANFSVYPSQYTLSVELTSNTSLIVDNSFGYMLVTSTSGYAGQILYSNGGGSPPTWGNLPSTTQPYDIIMSYIGNPVGGQQLYRAIIPRNVTLAASLIGSYIQCGLSPKNNWTATISVNGSIVGSATIPAYSISGSFSFATTVVISAGSMLEVDAPAVADVLTDPSITIVGTR